MVMGGHLSAAKVGCQEGKRFGGVEWGQTAQDKRQGTR